MKSEKKTAEKKSAETKKEGAGMLVGFTLAAFGLFLVGGALIETPVIGYINGENGLLALVCGIVFGALFIIPGVMLLKEVIADRAKVIRNESYTKELLEALKPGFKEASGRGWPDPVLRSFREHYSEFLSKEHVGENEAVQNDVTQIFRNILQLQKNRLSRLGLTCSLALRRMQYTIKDGLVTKTYSDGKYRIHDIREEVAAKTVYQKDGKEIYTRVDKDNANYTLISAEKVGEDRVVCPNCGAETTREALLDGCDYCGTKFSVEDLGTRVAVFAFRPDYKLRYEKYLLTRNKVLSIAVIAAILSVFLGFTIYAVVMFPTLLAEANGGIILTLLGSIFAILIASPVYIISLLVVYGWIVLPVVAVLAYFSWKLTKRVRNMKNAPMLAREWETKIRKEDPNFSIANFYSGVQNKLASVIFAENAEQLHAFAQGDLSKLLGKYSDVVGIDVTRMEIKNYAAGLHLQRAEVEAVLRLTRYNGKRCFTQRERIRLKLEKSAACKTQVVCAPAVLTCRGCGSSLDLLRGKRCPYCGRELDMTEYDWAIRELHRGLAASDLAEAVMKLKKAS